MGCRGAPRRHEMATKGQRVHRGWVVHASQATPCALFSHVCHLACMAATPKPPRHLLWANGAHGPNPKAKQHRGTQRVHSDRLMLACTAMWSAPFAHLCNGHVHIVAPTFGWGPTHAAMHTQWVRNGGSCCARPKECTPCGAWRPCHPEGDHSLAGAAHHHPATWASCSCAPQWGKKLKNAKSAQKVQVATDLGGVTFMCMVGP